MTSLRSPLPCTFMVVNPWWMSRKPISSRVSCSWFASERSTWRISSRDSIVQPRTRFHFLRRPRSRLHHNVLTRNGIERWAHEMDGPRHCFGWRHRDLHRFRTNPAGSGKKGPQGLLASIQMVTPALGSGVSPEPCFPNLPSGRCCFVGRVVNYCTGLLGFPSTRLIDFTKQG